MPASFVLNNRIKVQRICVIYCGQTLSDKITIFSSFTVYERDRINACNHFYYYFKYLLYNT